MTAIGDTTRALMLREAVIETIPQHGEGVDRAQTRSPLVFEFPQYNAVRVAARVRYEMARNRAERFPCHANERALMAASSALRFWVELDDDDAQFDSIEARRLPADILYLCLTDIHRHRINVIKQNTDRRNRWNFIGLFLGLSAFVTCILALISQID